MEIIDIYDTKKNFEFNLETHETWTNIFIFNTSSSLDVG